MPTYTIREDTVIVNPSSTYSNQMDGLVLASGGLVLYSSDYHRSWYQPIGISRIAVLDSGRTKVVELPSHQFVRNVMELPQGGLAVTCQEQIIRFDSARQSVMLNADFTVNQALTQAIAPYVVLGVQSDGGLIVADDARNLIRRLRPDGVEDYAWTPVSFAGAFANIYVGDDDQVYAYGAFNQIGGVGKNNLALINSFLVTGTRPGAATAILPAYPNPAKLFITLPTTKPGQAYTLTDMQGRTLRSATLGADLRVETASLPAGLYQLRTATARCA